MVVEQSNIDHIMRGLQSTEGVRLHNHRKKLRQRFDIIKKLGQGTYGKVQLGINKETGQEVAIKTIKKCKIETEADLVRIRREIQIMSSVRHPNIIHIYEVFENREKMVLVMEYAAGGELYDFLSERKVLEENEARRIFRQISTAVYYCHKHKICHRDLKLENILLDEHGSAKIADFGLSNVFDEQRLLNTFCGSPLYASPEIVKGTPYHGPEVDCWSLGVLLYTLVYGAMPFDGSNFKRLVKQISQGDYFEPKKTSPASPLIREMLTVNPAKRATIEQICSHWWVNQGFNVSCLDIAEDLANQTPVRLDLLLSLAPPPENSDKLVVTDDQSATAQEAPTRSMSVGSFMELDSNTEQRIREFVAQEVPSDNASEKTIKRKLEAGASESSVTKGGARKKERIKQSEQLKEKELIPETVEQSANKVDSNNMDVDTESNKTVNKVENGEKIPTENSANVDVKKLPEEAVEKVPAAEQKESEAVKPPETEKSPETVSKDKPTRKSVKTVKKKVTKDGETEKKDENEPPDSKVKVKKKKKTEETPTTPVEDESKKEEKKSESKEKEEAVGKEIKREGSSRKSRGSLKSNEKEKSQPPSTPDEAPSKPMERRKSKIFETAEKFMSNEPRSPTQEKPKKVFIPGVKVSDFAKAFERRSSVTSTPALKSSPSKKAVNKEAAEKKTEKVNEDEVKAQDREKEEISSQTNENQTENSRETKVPADSSKALVNEEPISPQPDSDGTEEPKPTAIDDEKAKKLKDSARNIISNALVEEERRKIKKQILKPPIPKTKSDLENKKKSLTLQIGSETATVQVHTPENTKFLFEPEEVSENKENIETPKEKKTAKVEITLKSNTLPRRTSKAEIQLSSPQTKDSFRTEVEHRVGDPGSSISNQRSEVAFPVSAPQKFRSMSLEPEGRKIPTQQSKERIIPIQFEDGSHKEESEARDRVNDLEKPMSQKSLPEGRNKPYQRSFSQRSSSLSRQSTQDSDTESTVSGEPIRKSPREFIIPIAVEGGGYVTPRAASLEPSESTSSKRSHRPFSRRISLWSDNGSEDESPFSALQKFPSRDFDEPFGLHRLRSTRPTKPSIERADSGSGSEEEEEEDDDNFEILTAENLFSTLLSRVRSLTQRLNVEDGLRPGFPSSRLMMNHFGPSERLLSNLHQPLTRLSERPEFGRSLSRDVENGLGRWSKGDLSDSESSRSIPRGHSKSRHSESDTESISESNTLPRQRKSKHHGEKKSKRSHSRTRSIPPSLTENEEVTEYVPTFDGNKSLYVPSHRVLNAQPYQKRKSDSALTEEYRPSPSSSSGIPKLQRTTSLKTDGPKRRPERKSLGIFEECLERDNFTEKDFYDILAEKYGITNVKRYDLSPTERNQSAESRSLRETSVSVPSTETAPETAPSVKLRSSDGKAKINENRRSLISLTEMDQKDRLKPKLSHSEQSLSEHENSKKQQKDILPPLPPKLKKEEAVNPEKYKIPSEKLAAVLNRLESSDKSEKPKTEVRGIPDDLLYGKKDPKSGKRASSVAPDSNGVKTSKKNEEFKKIESDRLAELSPKALELYEKTLGLYQKTVGVHSEPEKQNVKTIEKTEPVKEPSKKLDKVPEKTGKSGIPKNVTMARHKSDMSLKDYEKYDNLPTKEMLMNPEKFPKVKETPEKSVLGKYLHYSSLEDGFTTENKSEKYFKDKKLRHYGSLQSKLDTEKSEDGSVRPESKNNDVEITVTVKLPEKERSAEKSPEKRKSIKRLSKVNPDNEGTGENPEKKKVVKKLTNEETAGDENKKKEEESKKRAIRIEKLSKDLENESTKTDTEMEEIWKKKEEKAVKNKFLSSLEKKLERFRTPSDKKYVDKAIRSLRESSLGPKDLASENVLIKRAVSLSDCSNVKPIQPSRIQSTVNSVLGIFKKFENGDSKKKSKEFEISDNSHNERRTSIPCIVKNLDGKDEVVKITDKKDEVAIPNVGTSSATPKSVPAIEVAEKTEIPNPNRRASCNSGNNSLISGNDISLNQSSSAVIGFDDSSSFLSPDSESFDSWSNCSDFGTPDEFVPRLKSISPILKLTNVDDVVSESVGDRIRRKSFYSRFNERKKPRKSSILEGRKKYDQEMYEDAKTAVEKEPHREKHAYNRTLTQSSDKPRIQQPYLRSMSSADYSKKLYDDARPRPFYKTSSKSPTNESPITTPMYRKTSLDYPRFVTVPTFRSISQSSSGSNYSSSNPGFVRSYLDNFDSLRGKKTDSVYALRNSELDRPFSPVRTFSPTFRRSPSTNANGNVNVNVFDRNELT